MYITVDTNLNNYIMGLAGATFDMNNRMKQNRQQLTQRREKRREMQRLHSASKVRREHQPHAATPTPQMSHALKQEIVERAARERRRDAIFYVVGFSIVIAMTLLLMHIL